MEILKAKQKNQRFLLNDNTDIYGPCRHRTKFHRFHCTDELCESEKNGKYARPNKRRNLTCMRKRRAPLAELTNVTRSREKVRRTVI